MFTFSIDFHPLNLCYDFSDEGQVIMMLSTLNRVFVLNFEIRHDRPYLKVTGK